MTLSGVVQAPPSKSDAHRCLMAAALADGPTEIAPLPASADIQATLACLHALGARWDGARLTPIECPNEPVTCACGDSATTLRLLLPIACACGIPARFTGSAQLARRPLKPLLAAMAQNGARFDREELSIAVSGGLRPGVYPLPGDVSSQFISGLLYALPLLDGDSEIALTSPLESGGYVDMTLRTLARFGVAVARTDNGYHVPGRQTYHTPGSLAVEGDWSSAAYWLAAAAMGHPVRVEGLSDTSLQPDRAIVDMLSRMRGLHGIDVDVSATPDLAPVLAVLGAAAHGTIRLTHAKRLRWKESDRLESLYAMLRALGGTARIADDALIIEGTGALRGGTVDSRGDHRIAMAAAIAALLCSEPVTLLSADAVAKSYPAFWDDYRRLGGKCDGLDLR